jgi:glutamine amidotransferase-like uncharacterized protein
MSFRLLAASLLAIACQRDPAPANVLLFNGTGTNANDVAAVEQVLHEAGLTWARADSRQLGAMTPAQLRGYHLLIVPGGNFEQMGNGLTPATASNVRGAVQDGLNYLGICAGAFIAGNSPYNGFNLTSGVRFPFYGSESRGIRKAAVQITTADGSSLEQYWEDGPQLTGWGEVVARYTDGTPAVVQGKVGGGWVVLLGTHPEAPESWRRGLGFTTSGDSSRGYAAGVVLAALNGTSLRR